MYRRLVGHLFFTRKTLVASLNVIAMNQATPVRALTKKDFCHILGLTSVSGRTAYYRKLRQQYFTPEILTQVGITEQRYRSLVGGMPFTYVETTRLIAVFQIGADELEAYCRRI